MTRIQCLRCKAVVTHNTRHYEGCNCDPDAPHWCYIKPDGTIAGLRLAEWRVISDHAAT